MLSSPVNGYLILASIVFLASAAGLAIARFVPWTAEARKAGIPIAFGFACAPMLAGLLAVVALGLFDGTSHAFHLGFVAAGLIGIASLFFLSHSSLRDGPKPSSSPTGWEGVFFAVLLFYVLALTINTAALPLIQNDSLEYATVGRILFQTRDLASYPAVSSETEASGFYGPWTHPPLYVALVYLAYVFQGNADAPGLMKWISPWFALGGMGLVLALGNLRSRLAGLLGALVFLSAPLFFLSAGSAAIDPLPVLGLAMVFTAIVAVQGSAAHRGLVQGAVLGASLWTHSQAILFIPLTISAVIIGEGIVSLRRTCRQLILILGVAAAFAFWPYARNMRIYGALISDTPPVFAMPELAWSEYFRISRLIDSLSERIQYGMLKGWFAFESYSLTFWLMTIGVVLYLKNNPAFLRRNSFRNLSTGALPNHRLLCALGIMGTYFAGVAVSMLMGVDLMIRNERYWLVLSPFVALFGAEALLRLRACGKQGLDGDRRPRLLQTWLSRLVYPAAAALFLLQGVTFVAYAWRAYFREGFYLVTSANQTQTLSHLLDKAGYTRSTPDFLNNLLIFDKVSLSVDSELRFLTQKRVVIHNTEAENELLQWPNMRAMMFLKEKTPISALVLSFRPADMYYSNRRMISGLDPRMIPVYRESDVDQAFRLLMHLGITHVYLPDYDFPCITNTVLQNILARPDLAELVYSDAGFQIFRLVQGRPRSESEAFDFGPGVRPWTKVTQVTGGRKALATFSDSKGMVVMNHENNQPAGWPILQRDWSTTWISGIGHWETPLALDLNIPVSGEREYRLELVLNGHALVKIWLMQLDASGGAITAHYPRSGIKVKIGELVLGPTQPTRLYMRRFITHPQASGIRIGVEQSGHSRLQIKAARLIPINTGFP